MACHGPDDTCYVDAHCPEGQRCRFLVDDPLTETGVWGCAPASS